MEKIMLTLRLPLFIVGVILFFITERYFSAESYSTALTVSSLVLVLLSLVIVAVFFFKERRQKNKTRSCIWWLIGAWEKSVFFALLIYLIYNHLGFSTNVYDSILMKLLLGVWLLLLILGFFAGVGIEISQKSSGTGDLADASRVKRAAAEWLAVGMLLCFIVCINYVADKKDKTYDFSYLKSTSVGESTLKMVESLDKPLEISLFYPKNNDVRPYVEEYFNNLKSKTSKVEINFYDVDLNPTKAEELRVAKNGQIVLNYGGRDERMNTGLVLTMARNSLKTLDAKFQEIFLKLTQTSNVIYFSSGHGEMLLNVSDDSASPLRALSGLNTFLRAQNYNIRTWGVDDGSMQKVPEDAGALVIAGPIYPFAEAEVKAIEEYLKKGGSLFLLLDISKPSDNLSALDYINHRDPLIKMLENYGLKYNKQVLANDRNYVQVQSGPVDKWFLFSNNFTTHESVVNLARNDDRVAVLFFKSGYFGVEQNNTSGWKFVDTLRTVPDTFIDLNKNFNFDEKSETRSSYTVGVAGTYSINSSKSEDPKEGEENNQNESSDDKTKESKIIAYASSSIASDAILSNVANIVLISDSLRWLTGMSKFSGQVSSEEDVKIQHTRKENAIWFNITVAGVPLIILLFGFIFYRLRRKMK